MIYALGTGLSLFLSIILIGKNAKTFADKVLAVWLAAIGLHLFFYYLTFTSIKLKYPFILALDIPLPLIHGPLLYIYVAALTNQLSSKKIKLFFHFIPVTISYLALIPFYNLPNAEKIAIFETKGKGWEIVLLINLVGIYTSGIVYTVWCFLLLKNHRKSILNYFSYTDKINLKWLQYLIYGIGLIWIMVFIGNDNLIYVTVVIFVFFIGFYGIKQVGIFNHKLNNNETENSLPISSSILNRFIFNESVTTHSIPVNVILGKLVPNELDLKKEEIATQISSNDTDKINSLAEVSVSFQVKNESVAPVKKKYQKSGLTNEEATTIHQNLIQLMNIEKVFKNSELTLHELALKLIIQPNILSQVINSVENKNFYDFVNEKRINAFKEMADNGDYKKYTLLTIALECGFNSKTTFNRNFKKATGLSPTDYLKSKSIKIII